MESDQHARVALGCLAVQKSDYWHRPLLRARDERPGGRCATEDLDELAPPIKKMVGHDTTS